jgi:hypothetical protein
MAGKLDGSAIVSGSISSTQLDNSLNTSISQGGGPKITQIQITDSSYNVLDDTAISTSGGYIKITGTGFSAGAVVIIGTTNATATALVSSTILNVQVPALSAGTYTLYVVNSDGGTAIAVNGLTYSAEPSWVTGSTLPNGLNGSPISIQFDATNATTYTLQAGSSLPAGLTLTSGGLLSGTVSVGVETVYSFTVVATDAEAQDSPRAFTITIIVGDPYFYLTTLLLPGNGSNNGTNNTFLDSSTNSYTVTRFGNATHGTFSPFSLTGWSNYFDGSGDFLSWSGSTIGTQPFTAEMWVYPNSVNGTFALFGTASNGGFNLRLVGGSSTISVDAYNSAANSFTVPAWTANQWYHIVAVRNASNQLTVFVNGVRSSTGIVTMTTNFGATTKIGQSAELSDFNGYISNARLVIGSAVYDPTQATITVPTASLSAVANTSILTCQNNRFIDNSTNNFTITKNGNTAVASFSPFIPGSTYSAAVVGGSTYYDGTGDYLGTVNTPANFGSNSFTAETWVWFNSNNVGYQPIIMNTGTGDQQGWVIIIETNNTIASIASTNGSSWTNVITTSTVPTTNCWTHFALVRNSSTITLYVNGTSVGTTSIGASSIHSPSGAFYVGYYPFFPGGARSFNGYFSGTRLVNGTAVYTSNFTPPTAPPSPVTNTSLLLNYTNGQITDSTSKNDLETIGGANISTAQSKWGGSSMYFDGTGDYLYIANNLVNTISSGDFTIETWVYPTSFADWKGIIGYGPVNPTHLVLRLNASGNVQYWLNSPANIVTSNVALSLNTWSHIALVRSGSASNNVKLYVNGSLVGQSTSTYTVPQYQIVIGRTYDASDQEYFAGYLNDLRITKGYARYTANFTPPTGAFPTL